MRDFHPSLGMAPAEASLPGEGCDELQGRLLTDRGLIIASNRGPVTFQSAEAQNLQYQRGGGGLVTALTGLAKHVDLCWVACAMSDADRDWSSGSLRLDEAWHDLTIDFIAPSEEAYEGYYNVISNPLLWFLQHNMWDVARAPTIDRETWQAWETGYVQVNRMMAEAIARQVRSSDRTPLIMLQDYQLYLAPRFLRQILRPTRKLTLTHFIHIPWPGTEAWGILPPAIRRGILEGLLAVDLLGFQTREDGLNFIRTCETHLPRCSVNFKRGRVWYRNHATHVRDFPISIEVEALQDLAETEEVEQYRQQIEEITDGRQLIVRIDRTEPSKNIVRGFQAFDEMLENHPEHCGQVVFLAMLVPSRMEVDEYQTYLDELHAAAGRVNARHGGSDWEPVRLLVGENYPRAVAALQLYDALLINSIADGMNLVAKEGPVVNRQNGVVILSERTGSRQQLEAGALIISPLDIFATGEALHQALTMPPDERRERASRLRWIVEREDINQWMCWQLESIQDLGL